VRDKRKKLVIPSFFERRVREDFTQNKNPPQSPFKKGGRLKEFDMNFGDVVLAAVILAAAMWVFYRSFVKKKGHCAGCSGCACANKESRV
jgi:hypothetical protein